MTDTVQVPRELLERALTNIHYSRRELGADESKTERDLRKVLATPQVAAEPVAWVAPHSIQWPQENPQHRVAVTEFRGVSVPGWVPLYTHPKAEPVNQQLLLQFAGYLSAAMPELGVVDVAVMSKHVDAFLAAAEAQPALPTQEQIMRLADEYANQAAGGSFHPSMTGAHKTRAALQAALAALPKENSNG